MPTELKPCPFCGGEAKLSKNTIVIRGVSEECAWVYCKNCRNKTNYSMKAKGGETYISHAVGRWNRRASDAY